MEQTQPGSPKKTETYSYNITIRNTGTLTATNVLLRDVLPDSVLNTGRHAGLAIGDLLPSAGVRHHQPDSGERSAVCAVPVGEHDHRDRRQRRSALADIYRHGFAIETVCPDHNNARYFVDSADRQLHVEVEQTQPGSLKKMKSIPYNITVRNTGTLIAKSNVLLRDAARTRKGMPGIHWSLRDQRLLPSASETFSQSDSGER